MNLPVEPDSASSSHFHGTARLGRADSITHMVTTLDTVELVNFVGDKTGEATLENGDAPISVRGGALNANPRCGAAHTFAECVRFGDALRC